MKYSKPPLTYQQQADQLLVRGLHANREVLIKRLRAVSYYRLSGYWYPFRNSDNSFKPNTTLDIIWNRYTFDRRLRLLVMDAIERVEVSVRTSLVFHLAHSHGAFGYRDSSSLPNLTDKTHEEFLRKISHETKQSKEAFVVHFKDKYGDCHKDLPLWMAAEVMSFGMLLTLFHGVESSIKKEIAREYHMPDKVLGSWLRALNSARNICAHHRRLWNRELGYKPMIPKQRKHPEWYEPVAVGNNRVFSILTILKYFMNRVAPQSSWTERFEQLLSQYPDIPLRAMGFPENWQECPIWKGEK